MSAGRGRLSWPAPAAAAGWTAGLPADKRGARSPSSRWPLSASIRRAACTTSGLGSASAALLNGRDRAVSQRPRPVPRQGIRSGIAGHARPQGRRPRQRPAARSRAPLKRQQAVVRTRPAITQPGEKRPVTLRQQYPVLLLEPGRRSFRQGRAQHETMAMGAEAFQPPAASFAKLDANPGQSPRQPAQQHRKKSPQPQRNQRTRPRRDTSQAAARQETMGTSDAGTITQICTNHGRLYHDPSAAHSGGDARLTRRALST